MKVLSNHWPYVLLIGFAIFCFIWWMCKFCAAKFPEDLLSRQASEFRNNAFIGFDGRDLEKSFGRPLHSVVLEHVGEEDFFWWPSFYRDDTPWPKIKKDQKVRFRCFADGDLLLHVCEVVDSNDVWRVIGDVTPGNNIVF